MISAALIHARTHAKHTGRRADGRGDGPGEDPVGEAVSLELGGQARLPQLLKQADEVVRIQLEGFPCSDNSNQAQYGETGTFVLRLSVFHFFLNATEG